MKKIKRKLCSLIYNLIAKHMPLSNGKINLGQKRLRRYLMSNLIAHMGKNVNIEKGASIVRGCSIGDTRVCNIAVGNPVKIIGYRK